MSDQPFDVVAELPVADIQIGANSLRIYGFADIEPRLVEVRSDLLVWPRLNLTCEQAEAIAKGLLSAVAKARADGG